MGKDEQGRRRGCKGLREKTLRHAEHQTLFSLNSTERQAETRRKKVNEEDNEEVSLEGVYDCSSLHISLFFFCRYPFVIFHI